MKRAAIIAFVIFFAVGMFHYFYAEDHCPVHCPSRGGGFGHVHQHLGGAATCLCFWISLFGPETGDWVGATDYRVMTAPADVARLRGPLGADIAHPPKSSLV
jgi:hypothetical protein